MGYHSRFRIMVAALLLVALLPLQAILFWPVMGEFFTPDGIYYLARQVDDWDDLKTTFTRLDDVANYRPLTYLVATLLSSVWALDPFPYHVFALAGHMVVTALVFWLARLLFHSQTAVIAMVLFFGFHSAASRVAFGIAFLSDLLYAAFFVFAIIAFVKFERGCGKPWLTVSLLSFVLSLLSKEPAVTMPVVLTALLVFVPGLSLQNGRRQHSKHHAMRRTLPFWILAAVYLGWFAFLTGGSFVPQDPSHPYYVSLSWDDFASKRQYVEWALNVDFGTLGGHPTISRLAHRFLSADLAESLLYVSDFWLYLVGPIWMLWLLIRGEWQYLYEFTVPALATPLMVIAVFVLIRSTFHWKRDKEDRTAFYGVLFFFVVLLPVLILPVEKTMLHNLYLPVVGLSILVGQFTRTHWHSGGRLDRVLAVSIPALLVAAGVQYISFSLKEGWPTTSARMGKNYLEDVQQRYPELPRGAILYFHKTGDTHWPYFTAAGDLFRAFYGDSSLITLFGDYEQSPPPAGFPRPVIRFHKTDDGLIPTEKNGDSIGKR
jgi:hypothetical protein